MCWEKAVRILIFQMFIHRFMIKTLYWFIYLYILMNNFCKRILFHVSLIPKIIALFSLVTSWCQSRAILTFILVMCTFLHLVYWLFFGFYIYIFFFYFLLPFYYFRKPLSVNIGLSHLIIIKCPLLFCVFFRFCSSGITFIWHTKTENSSIATII